MNHKLWHVGAGLLFSLSLSPVLAQGRWDQPGFFQNGSNIFQQEINRLQIQQRQQIESSQNGQPSNLLSIDDGALQWQQFLFQTPGFAVWMPIGVQSDEDTNLVTGIETIPFEVTASNTANSRFVVAYSEKTLPSLDPKSLLEQIRDGIIAKTQFQLQEQSFNRFQSFPGLRFTLTQNENMITFQIYLINDRAYVLALSQKSANSQSEEHDRFFNSFQLLSSSQ